MKQLRPREGEELTHLITVRSGAASTVWVLWVLKLHFITVYKESGIFCIMSSQVH